MQKYFTNLLTTAIIISTILAVENCKKAEPVIKNVIPEETIGIILNRNSVVRIDPFIFSARISLLKKGATVEILEKSKEKSNIARTRDYWYKIKQDNDFVGWIYGKNIRQVGSDSDEKTKKFIDLFFKEETEELMKKMAGKWWSTNRFGDFTGHVLEIYSDGKYKSYMNYKNRKVLKGEYDFDFDNDDIIFKDKTTFGKKLDFTKRGKSFILSKELKVGELRFKLISNETLLKLKVEKEEKLKNEKKDKDGNKNK